MQRGDAGCCRSLWIAADAAIETGMDAALMREADRVAVRSEPAEGVGEAECARPVARAHQFDQALCLGLHHTAARAPQGRPHFFAQVGP